MILLFGSSLMAQDVVEPDSRIFSRYNVEEIQNLSQNHPEKILAANIELQDGFEFVEMPDEKLEGLPQLYYYDYMNKIIGGLVENVDVSTFNLYEYKYERLYDTRLYYRIGNTNNVLVIISHKEFANKINESRNHE
jgi:hypothetical protein